MRSGPGLPEAPQMAPPGLRGAEQGGAECFSVRGTQVLSAAQLPAPAELPTRIRREKQPRAPGTVGPSAGQDSPPEPWAPPPPQLPRVSGPPREPKSGSAGK